MPDFAIEDHGTIVLFRPLNADATAFLHSAVDAEPWQFFGDTLCVEARYAVALVEGLRAEGFAL